jgi:hypothetical protein
VLSATGYVITQRKAAFSSLMALNGTDRLDYLLGWKPTNAWQRARSWPSWRTAT